MNPEKDPLNVGEELLRLEQAVRAERDSRKRAANASRLITALIGCTFLFFILINYLHFRSHWTEDKFKRSLERELMELSPVAMRELNAMGKELLPIFIREGNKQFTVLMPEISTTMEREIDQLVAEILEKSHRNLIESQERVLARTEDALFSSYPDLRDAGKRAELQKRFHRIADEAALAALADFDRLFSRDLETIRARLLKFDLKDTGESGVDLQKKFLRLWLRLMDEEIKEL